MGKDLKGKNLGKGISQRKDGRYEARCSIKGNTIRIIGTRLSDVKKEFEEKKRNIGMQNSVEISNGYTLEEWFNNWFINCKSPQLKNELCCDVYKRKIYNTYISILGNKKLKDITQMNIQMATNELAKTYAERTLTEALSALKDCLNVAIANNLLLVNPCVSIYVKGKEHQRKEDALTPEEIEEFKDVIKDSFYYEQYLILIYSGLRIGEFSALKDYAIDYKNKCFHITTSLSTGYYEGNKVQSITVPKTKFSVRDVPFIGNVEELLHSWENKRDTCKANLGNRWRIDTNVGETYFTTSLGSPSTRYSMGINLRVIEKELNTRRKLNGNDKPFPHLHPHLFRKTCCTLLYLHGIPVEKTQRILGHSSISITMDYYTSISKSMVSDDIKRIDNFLHIN